MVNCQHPIGILDSGVGGISVLCELRRCLPHEDYIYYADTAYAPYGIQSVNAVRNHVLRVIDFLIEHNCKAIVVACNTATSAAIEDIRNRLPHPIVGMEPALKPAVARYKNQHIVVMGTPMTLQEEKFQQLLARFSANTQISLLPDSHLVELVEQGQTLTPQTVAYIQSLFAPYSLPSIKAVVLGCTHFLFVKPALQRVLGSSVDLVDGNHGTALQLKRLLAHHRLLNKTANLGAIKYNSSGSEEALQVCRHLYQWGTENL